MLLDFPGQENYCKLCTVYITLSVSLMLKILMSILCENRYTCLEPVSPAIMASNDRELKINTLTYVHIY